MGYFKKLGDLCVNTYPEELQSKFVNKSKTILYTFVKRNNVNPEKKKMSI